MFLAPEVWNPSLNAWECRNCGACLGESLWGVSWQVVRPHLEGKCRKAATTRRWPRFAQPDAQVGVL